MIDEDLLNDEGQLAAADEQGILRSLAGSGAQVRQALQLAQETPMDEWSQLPRPRAIVVAARGGSSVVADAVATLVGRTGPVPVIALSGGTLPSWVGAVDLVIGVSLSGRADGTVAIVQEAGRRGALVLTVGRDDTALHQASQWARGVHIGLPAAESGVITVPTSRTALWSLLTPALVACQKLGLLVEQSVDLLAVAAVLDTEAEKCRPSSESFVNPSKVLALELDECIPVVLGTDDASVLAARRAAAVLSRTARVPAVHGGLPNDASEVVATFGGPFAASSEESLFADFEAGDKPERVLRLAVFGRPEDHSSDAILKIAGDAGVKVSHVHGQADSDIALFAQLALRADFAATYLALGQGTNPAINPFIADLRDALG